MGNYSRHFLVRNKSVGGASSYIQTVLGIDSSNLIGLWACRALSGTDVPEESGEATLDATSSSITWDQIDGPKGEERAGLWNGNPSEISIPHAALETEGFDPDNITMVCWMKPTWAAAARNAFAIEADSSNVVRLAMITPSGWVEAYTRYGGTVKNVQWDSGSPTDWFMLALRVTGGVLTGFQNDTNKGTATSLGTFAGSLARARIGSRLLGQRHWVGYLMYAGLWKTGLSDAQITGMA